MADSLSVSDDQIACDEWPPILLSSLLLLLYGISILSGCSLQNVMLRRCILRVQHHLSYPFHTCICWWMSYCLSLRRQKWALTCDLIWSVYIRDRAKGSCFTNVDNIARGWFVYRVVRGTQHLRMFTILDHRLLRDWTDWVWRFHLRVADLHHVVQVV